MTARLFWQPIIWQVTVNLQKYIYALELVSEDFQILKTAPQGTISTVRLGAVKTTFRSAARHMATSSWAWPWEWGRY